MIDNALVMAINKLKDFFGRKSGIGDEDISNEGEGDKKVGDSFKQTYRG